MPLSAKIYLSTVISGGMALVVLSISQLAPVEPMQFAVFLILGLLGSGMKVRLPGVSASMSISFLPILMSAVLLSAAESVVVAAAAAVAQCYLRAQKRPSLVHLAFNVSSLAISARIASAVSQEISAGLVAVILAAAAYYLMNATLLCAVIATTQSKAFTSVWDRTYWLSLPYYASGAALVFVAINAGGHASGLVVLPVMLLAYKYYAQWMGRPEQAA